MPAKLSQIISQLRLQLVKLWQSAYLHKSLLLSGTARYMLIFLGITFLFVLYVRFVWRRGKPFQEP